MLRKKFFLAALCYCLTFLYAGAQTLEKEGRINASDYHEIRNGLRNSKLTFERKKKGRVAFLGGSITQNPGWRDSVCAYLTKRFPQTEFDFVPAGIGSMGTTPAAFRLERDVLSKGKIDLLFEEAAVNDAVNGRTATEQLRAMEGIVRHVRKANSATDIIMMHFADPDKMEAYRTGEKPEVIKNHDRVAVHYGIPTIDLAREVTHRIDHGEFNWEEDFVDLHPSPFGQGVYARSIIRFLEHSYGRELGGADRIIPHTDPAKLDRFCYDRGRLLDVSKAKFSKAWHIDPQWSPNDGTGTRANYTNVPMLVNDRPGSILKLRFKGNAVGIAVASGQDAGNIQYRIDGQDWQLLDLFTKWSSSLHLPWYHTLASELADGPHTLELRVARSRNPKSNGQACRIRYFYVNAK